MLDYFDYAEPTCLLCGGKEFYNPELSDAVGRIPIRRIIEKLDELFNVNDMDGAGKLLEYWLNEAVSLNDKEGELAVLSELLGYYRKVGNKEKGLESVEKSKKLIDELYAEKGVAAATILLNAATTMKCFGLSKEAISVYDEAYAVYEKTLKKDDLSFAGFYNNKALCLVDLKKYDKAEECYKNALQILNKKSKVLPDIAVTKVNMAHLYYEWNGDKKQITDCLFDAYGVLTDEKVQKNGYYAYVCSKCAPSFEFFGYDVIAKELQEMAKNIYARN